jgi:hypothetical protein
MLRYLTYQRHFFDETGGEAPTGYILKKVKVLQLQRKSGNKESNKENQKN